jgi:hypothetical protein
MMRSRGSGSKRTGHVGRRERDLVIPSTTGQHHHERRWEFHRRIQGLGLLSAHYAWKWVKETDPNGRLQMPGSRVMTPGKPDAPRWYWANTRRDACPQGFNTEETIKELWGTR